MNYLSRLDELTKSENFRREVVYGDVVICEATFEAIRDLGVNLEHKKLRMSDMSLSIRDFPESTSVYLVKTNNNNQELLQKEIRKSEDLGDNDRLSKLRKIA